MPKQCAANAVTDVANETPWTGLEGFWRGGRDSKTQNDSADSTQKPAVSRTETTPEPNGGNTKPNADTLRAALDRAIVDGAWDAVRVINERLRELERPANVVELSKVKR